MNPEHIIALSRKSSALKCTSLMLLLRAENREHLMASALVRWQIVVAGIVCDYYTYRCMGKMQKKMQHQRNMENDEKVNYGIIY